MHILDSSAFIHEYHTDEPTASIPMVEEELEGEHAYRFDAMEGAGMHIHMPAEETVERIQRAATETGDAAELSPTDTRLLAAAFELDGTLVSDDYAMQNVAERLDVSVQVIARDGITEEREWRFQCAGCGREFDENKPRCPICGSDLSRKNPA
ncbi:MAG: putative nucleic acid-binding protein, consists of a PIN domain and a Zn-ribbon module [uncultured archaeon A07HR60]|nr:MAG: putative nucleic acid-binding protein, consists of a PIN domain and a Zn-ribbon module [Halorubrum sp. J07HR59]ESS12526.1 MAG: putative nucleic acid-binding protein, consists of a PIN domain and a Zn-ribbon module [uncultured archaeon A07HR60]